jgi:penicillin G amidase
MNSEPTPNDPLLVAHRYPSDDDAAANALTRLQARRRIFLRTVIVLTALVVIVAAIAFLYGRHWTNQAMRDSLPQIDGTFAIPGLSAPVTVERDNQGVPHFRAASMDDLVIAQGYVTAQDRLWQMETLRRHAAGTLAEILGHGLLAHDRAQRTMQIAAAADRAIAVFPPDQLHWLTLYASGVNASIEAQRAHLPLEFRILGYQPEPWTPRDTILVALAMFQDLTNSFPDELDREALTARLPLNLVADLYPVGSWRDHPPAQPTVDLTAPQPDIPNIPLDESQSKLEAPAVPSRKNPGVPSEEDPSTPSSARTLRLRWAPREGATAPAHLQSSTASIEDLLTLQQTLKSPTCDNCKAGSNNWAVSGTHTATGKPLLSNDMHLNHGVPGTWYEADLEAPTPTGEFHVSGVSLPGTPFIIVGHNDHIAWGFTNLGATVQDLEIEHLRGTGPTAEYETPTGIWKPVIHKQEIIHVKGAKDVVLDVLATQHGNLTTPIISGIFPSEKRSLSLNWTIYDPANLTAPFFAINSATGWPDLHAAFANWGGPSQNLVFADDQGHIGYHAVGKVPIRGSLTQPTPISPLPTDALDTTQQWAGYIPFDQLPQAFDPPNGILATANARVTPDNYLYPITLDWSAPYRNERIWKVLTERAASTQNHLTPADMLALQTDVYSDVDHVIAQRLAYAIDHATTPAFTNDKRLHQAADLLRDWNGNVDADAAAPAIVDAARTALWPLIIDPQLKPEPEPDSASNPTHRAFDPSELYIWGEKSFAEEWLIMHTPARWLPAKYPTWDDLLTAAVATGLRSAHAPFNLANWRYGDANPIDIEHPIFSQSPLLQLLTRRPTGTGVQPQSGDHTTVKQVGRSFGPSERFTANLSNLDHSTLNIVLGQSGDPASPWFMSQWPAWYHGTTLAMPFTNAAVDATTVHTLTLAPK